MFEDGQMDGWMAVFEKGGREGRMMVCVDGDVGDGWMEVFG